MLATQGLNLRGRLLLLLGNGPSSWWASHGSISRLRSDFPEMVVAACNRTAAKVDADLACAVDRAMVDEFLTTGVFRERMMLVGDEVFRTSLAELPEIPEGLKDASLEHGGNVFVFPPSLNGTGTGSAAFQTFATMHCDGIYLSGFDGSKDPRTRWQGTDCYRAGPTNPQLLDEWNRQIIAAGKLAVRNETVGLIGGDKGHVVNSLALLGMGNERNIVSRIGAAQVERMVCFFEEARRYSEVDTCPN